MEEMMLGATSGEMIGLGLAQPRTWWGIPYEIVAVVKQPTLVGRKFVPQHQRCHLFILTESRLFTLTEVAKGEPLPLTPEPPESHKSTIT